MRMFTEPFLLNFQVDYKTTNLDIKLVLDVDIFHPWTKKKYLKTIKAW